MEVSVRVAARVAAGDPYDGGDGVRVEGMGVRSPDGRYFPVEAAVAAVRGDESSARELYAAVAAPQLACFLDGCDTSVVLFGQTGTGKTYTLLGPGPHSIYDDQNYGIIPRFLRDAFDTLDRMPERSHVIHLTWMRLLNGGVTDLLGCGLAKCSNLIEALHYLAKGSANTCFEPCHTVFTISIEQKWIGHGGILFHRLSTASFCELSSYPEPSLLALEEIIRDVLQNDQKPVDYEKSLLTEMLRDSFGGRAFTWIICCLDSDMSRVNEMIKILELCWCCRGIKNFVTVNGFADNNTPLNVDKNVQNRGGTEQYFGLQFAAQQWIKLVSNAEGLFHKILQSNSLSKSEIAQINEWLFLKAECDECLNPTIGNADNAEDIDVAKTKNALPRITEDTEPSEPSDSEIDSDASLQHDDFLFSDKLCKYMEYFREKTDELTFDRCEEYLHCGGAGDLETTDTCISESSAQLGRRKTIQPGESLTGDELELLRRAAANAVSPESQKIIVESHKASEDPESKLVQRELMKMIDSPVPSETSKKYKLLLQKYTLKQNMIEKLTKNIQDFEIQLKELVSLCVAKEQLIQDLAKIVKRQNNVKLCMEKDSSLNDELKKARSELINVQAKLENDSKNPRINQQVMRCKSLVDYYEKCVLDRELGKRLDCDNNKEIKKHENKLKAYRKQIEQVKKQIKRDEKRKNTLELEIVKDKSKLDEMQKQDSANLIVVDPKSKDKKQHSLKQVSVRISHLDHILKEKTSNLQKCGLSDDKESMLRREIRNLRKTRECLMEQRCILGQKRKIQRSLSDTEERKLLEYEEAIEAIDTAIEYKNELICGGGQSLMSTGSQRERGEELLMARLSKLSNNEMRTLLYKYFQKVIDLRTTCVSLEAAAGAAQQEAGGWRRRCGDAWAALQHARLAHARRTTTLTARHYHTLNQLMNEIAGDAESDNSIQNGINNRMPLQLEYPRQLSNRIVESDVENIMTHHSRIASTTAKIKFRDNVMQEDRFLDKIQEVARYQQSGIPSQNLKQLQHMNSDPRTKVTRQKNKLVIQEVQSNK